MVVMPQSNIYLKKGDMMKKNILLFMNVMAAVAVLQQVPAYAIGDPQPAQIAVAQVAQEAPVQRAAYQNPYERRLEEALRLTEGENANFAQAMEVLHLIDWEAPPSIKRKADLAEGIMYFRGGPGLRKSYRKADLFLVNVINLPGSSVAMKREALLLLGLINKDGDYGAEEDKFEARVLLMQAAQPGDGVPESIRQEALKALAEVEAELEAERQQALKALAESNENAPEANNG